MPKGLGAAIAGAAIALGVGVAAPLPSAQATTSTSSCSTASLLGIKNTTGELIRWSDATPTAAGGFVTTTVAPTWTNARLLASDSATGDLFGVFSDGKLRKYTYSAGEYVNGTEIGTGWSAVTHLIPMGQGVIYAIFNDGTMRFYKVVGDQTTGGTVIGSGWQTMSTVASGGNGIIYAADEATGKLYWYKRSNFASATGTWGTRKEVGTGWGAFTHLLGAGDGILYGIQPDGAMRWYNHAAATTGAASWATGSGTVIGNGWNNFRAFTVNPNACTPGNPQGGYRYILDPGTVLRSELDDPHHNSNIAIDLQLPIGTPVYAVTGGTANHYTTDSAGTAINLLGEDGAQYGYFHLSSRISHGTQVRAGDYLGRSGNTGESTGPHLHYRILLNGVARCPQKQLLALYDGLTPPAPSLLPTSGCNNPSLRAMGDE